MTPLVTSCSVPLYQGKNEFPFVDTGGNGIATVKAKRTWDVAGDYLLTDSQTGEDLVVLDNDFSLDRDSWRIRDADDGPCSRRSTRVERSSSWIESFCRSASGSPTSTG